MVFCVTMPCSLVGDYQHYGESYHLYHQSKKAKDGGNRFLSNVGNRLQDYTVILKKTIQIFFSLLQKPQISKSRVFCRITYQKRSEGGGDDDNSIFHEIQSVSVANLILKRRLTNLEVHLGKTSVMIQYFNFNVYWHYTVLFVILFSFIEFLPECFSSVSKICDMHNLSVLC
jgi:hypothetical protein